MNDNGKKGEGKEPIKVLTPEDVFRLHKEIFGVEPVITGANFWQSDKLIDLILDAIEKGEPYVEPDVPEDMDV